jgi:hypothetical protein
MHKVFGDREKEVMDQLENDVQKIIFMDWWTGNCINGKWLKHENRREHHRAKRYLHVSDHDWDVAYGYIMETISLGMG